MDNMKSLVIVLAVFCGTVSVQAGIYKWTDENGKVHYTQTPPPKEGTRENISANTYNSVQTVKAPAMPMRVQRTAGNAGSYKKAATTKKKVKKRTQVKRSRCSRR